MRQMKRITVQQVLDAYQQTGLSPIQRCHCAYFHGELVAADALNALLVSRGLGEQDTVNDITRLLEIDRGYFWDFMYGYDGCDTRHSDSEGCKDGTAAYLAVFGGGNGTIEAE